MKLMTIIFFFCFSKSSKRSREQPIDDVPNKLAKTLEYSFDDILENCLNQIEENSGLPDLQEEYCFYDYIDNNLHDDLNINHAEVCIYEEQDDSANKQNEDKKKEANDKNLLQTTDQCTKRATIERTQNLNFMSFPKSIDLNLCYFDSLNNLDDFFGDFKKYFEGYLQDIPYHQMTKIKSVLLSVNKENSYTFKNKKRIAQNLCIVPDLKIYNIITKLENRYLVNFNNIYKYFMEIRARNSQFINEFNNLSYPKEPLKNFVDKFIYDETIKNYFSKLEKTQNGLENMAYQEKLQFLLESFNKFMYEYYTRVATFLFHSKQSYLNFLVSKIGKHKQKDLINDFQVIIDLLFNNNDNRIILVLFPELKAFFEKIRRFGNFSMQYKLYHIVISLVIFKFHLTLPIIQKEYEKNSDRKDFIFTDSKRINLFILETRCLISVLGCYFFDNFYSPKIFLFRTFISFVRCEYPSFLKYIVMNDFFDYISKVEAKNLKDIKYYYSDYIKKSNNVFFIFQLFEIPTFLVSEDYLELSEVLKTKIYFVDSNLEEENIGRFIQIGTKHIDVMKKVDVLLKEYIKENL